MKRILSFLFCIISFCSFSQDMIIAGVGHGFNGNNGFIELYVVNDFAFDTYVLYTYNQTGTSIGSVAIYGPQNAGTSIYITPDNFFFEPFFGFPATYEESAGFINGDDTIILELNFSTIVDIYGQLGVDGSGMAWDYLTGWAYRKNGFGPNPTFTLSEWDIYVDAFDPCGSTNLSCPNPYPYGTYTLSETAFDNFRDLKIVPNPVKSGEIQFLGTPLHSAEVTIYDILGNVYQTLSISDNKLVLHEISKGVYFLRIDQENNFTIKKLIVN